MSRNSVFTCLAGVLIASAIAAGCDDWPTRPSTAFRVSSISPSAGTTLGGTHVSISGVGFASGATVAFDGIPVPATVVSTSRLTADVPPHMDGVVDVVVTNPTGESGQLRGAYNYIVQPAFGISGRVTELTDEGEIPLAGVEITESARRISVTTDATGAYQLAGQTRSSFVMRMCKDGYDTVQTPVASTSDVQLNVRMRRSGS